jgi:hypothetical protein
LVYTGKGAIHWMFDLPAWAAKVAQILRPGGWLILFDFHPMMWLFRDGEHWIEVNPVSYFAPIIKYRGWVPGDFAGPDSPTSAERARIASVTVDRRLLGPDRSLSN